MGEPDAGLSEGALLAGSVARRASAMRSSLRAMSGGERASMLRAMAAGLRAGRDAILRANAVDLAEADGLSGAMRDRLMLDAGRVEAMACAVESIAGQEDALGVVVEGRVLGNGIRLEKRRVPLGTVAVIYESRPNVTSDAAALCLKSGNAVVLKGGSEALATNRSIVSAMRGALASRGVEDAVGFVETADRSATMHLVTLSGVIDLVVPRGGAGLIRAVGAAATVPVVKHDAGVCHAYVDSRLDDEGVERAVSIVENGKAQRPGVCNALETLLVHRDVAQVALPKIASRLRSRGVELRCDARSLELLGGVGEGVVAAEESDWGAEYLSLVLAVRIVDSLEDACSHIDRHGSGHTEVIVTDDVRSADRFVELVDSASVMVNCSSRFADGGEYGLGAEIGISTDKLHARGPMGAADLTTFQWVAVGRGQVRG